MTKKLTFNEIRMFFAGMGEQVQRHWFKKFDNDDKFIYWVPDFQYQDEWPAKRWFGLKFKPGVVEESYYKDDLIYGAHAMDYTIELYDEFGRAVLLVKRGIKSQFGDRFEKLEWLKDKNG